MDGVIVLMLQIKKRRPRAPRKRPCGNRVCGGPAGLLLPTAESCPGCREALTRPGGRLTG